jgi:DNA-binding response OmpR family regulator
MTPSTFVILYVEDNVTLRESVAELLAMPDRRFICVSDGAGARAALREHAVHLLVTDIDLPDASGLDVAREALERNPALPVIVCSGYDVREVTRSLGATAHPLMKPFDLDELEALVDRLLR